MTIAHGYAAFSSDTPLAPCTFERRAPRDQDVQIDILYCGVCHSDLHTARGDWDGLIYPDGTIYPCVPGHEIVGRVAAVDWVTASPGGVSPLQQIPAGPGYQLPLAEAIKATGVNTIAVGLITEPRQAEAVIAGGQADLVALARAMLYDPRWAWHAAAELGAAVEAPPPYQRSQPQGLKNLFGDVVLGQR